MNCPRCGSWQPNAGVENRFCGQCGTTLPVAPQYYAESPYSDDVVPAMAPDPTMTVARQNAPTPPPGSSTELSPGSSSAPWMRHPGTWIAAATALLAAGIVLAAVIVSGGTDETTRPAAAAPGSTSAPASAVATTVAPAAAPSTATQTVVVVPVAPGAPATETRTVTVAPDTPSRNSGGYDGTAVSASYYQRGDTVYFDSPSHNIGCRLVSGGYQAQCTIKDYEFDEPGYDCPHGAGVLMDSGDSPVIDCIQSGAYGGESTLDYGEHVTFGAFTCSSRSSGITCQDGYGTGFTLSRESYTSF